MSSEDPHGWTPILRLQTTAWFNRWLYERNQPSKESTFEPEPASTLYCTPEGSLRSQQKGQTIFSLIAREQEHLPPQSTVPRTANERETFQDGMRQTLGRLLRYRKSDRPLKVRHIVTTPRIGYRIEKIQFLSESGIFIPAWVYVPTNSAGTLPAILYVNDEGMEADGMEFAGTEESGLQYGVLDSLARAGYLVVAVDVRGIGETKPLHSSASSTSDFRNLFDLETEMAYMAWSMDQSLLGMRVQDVVRSVDYVEKRPDFNGRHLHVIGRGRGGLWCLYAAALDLRISSLICVRCLLAYRSLITVDRYRYSADVFVPDVLLHFDLPQVAAALVDRSLTLVQPQDAMNNAVNVDAAESVYRWTRDAYKAAGMASRFRIENQAKDADIVGQYLRLMREGNRA